MPERLHFSLYEFIIRLAKLKWKKMENIENVLEI